MLGLPAQADVGVGVEGGVGVGVEGGVGVGVEDGVEESLFFPEVKKMIKPMKTAKKAQKTRVKRIFRGFFSGSVGLILPERSVSGFMFFSIERFSMLKRKTNDPWTFS